MIGTMPTILSKVDLAPTVSADRARGGGPSRRRSLIRPVDRACATAAAPESAAARYERERIDAWIQDRLIAYPLASCFGCRQPIIAGQDWQEVSNGDTNARARFHRNCHAEWRAEREAAARQALGLEG